ncbi:hypothetical protein NC651_024552 [Populus alba x Populus x berolinensis]|nr:hypothetical protein NC651_024552 [Populus alba x Populus x berolinensis]
MMPSRLQGIKKILFPWLLVSDKVCGEPRRKKHDQRPKRTRSFEMHNVSRRRDRIKGKLRALQELIPNCHKFAVSNLY